MPRLFLGLPLDAATQQALDQFRAQQPAAPGVRWTPAVNRHVTLYFFGEIAPEMQDNLVALLTLGLRDAQAFELAFDRYCLAPRPRAPRMIWARYHKHAQFRELVQHLHSLYQQIDPQQQMRKSPVPHITLARLRQWPEGQPLAGPFPPLPALSVREAILWESTRQPGGTRYTEQARFGLRS